ncbi:hypothetical protein ACFLW6_01675 [Chloroflexota bacterium]
MKRIRIIGSIVLTALLLVGMLAFTPGSVSAQDGSPPIDDPSGITMDGSGEGKSVVPLVSSLDYGDIIFEQPPLTPSVYPEAGTSDADLGYLCFEDFWGLASDIYDIHWWGLSLVWASGWSEGDPKGMEFEIIFYEDAGGSPGGVVATCPDIKPAIEFYPDYFFNVYRFDVAHLELDIPLNLTEGWVSIQSMPSLASDDSFLWLTSPVGDLNAIQEPGPVYLNKNLSFALTSSFPEGSLTGGGQIVTDDPEFPYGDQYRVSFAGNLGYKADFSLAGQYRMNFHNVSEGSEGSLDGAKFHSTDIVELQFFKDSGDGPDPSLANPNVAHFIVEGRLNGEEGYTLDAYVADRGEPGNNDSISFELWHGVALIYSSSSTSDFPHDASIDKPTSIVMETLAAGNLQIHSGVKGNLSQNRPQ